MESKTKGLWPTLTLFFLSPAIGELLSGSAPPAEFFNPLALLLLACLYGSGAILVRELTLRWGKGWPTIFTLGAAYGIIEEGLMVKSFFDPNWVDLDILGVYGRWAGVNWVWSLELTIYHAVISIAIPILLVELLFPAQHGRPWLARRGMILHTVLFVGVVIFGFIFLTPYRPPLVPYLLAILAVGFLVYIARRLPVKFPALADSDNIQNKPVPKPRAFLLIGFCATLTFFIFNWVFPNLNIPVLITMLATMVLVIFMIRQVRIMSRQGKWGDKHQLALASGALGFFILLGPLQELDTARPDNTSGMALAALLALVGLIWLWRRIRKPANPSPQPGLA